MDPGTAALITSYGRGPGIVLALVEDSLGVPRSAGGLSCDVGDVLRDWDWSEMGVCVLGGRDLQLCRILARDKIPQRPGLDLHSPEQPSRQFKHLLGSLLVRSGLNNMLRPNDPRSKKILWKPVRKTRGVHPNALISSPNLTDLSGELAATPTFVPLVADEESR